MTKFNVVALVLAAALPLLEACKPMPVLAHQTPSTPARIENDLMATRPANSVAQRHTGEIG